MCKVDLAGEKRWWGEVRLFPQELVSKVRFRAMRQANERRAQGLNGILGESRRQIYLDMRGHNALKELKGSQLLVRNLQVASQLAQIKK